MSQLRFVPAAKGNRNSALEILRRIQIISSAWLVWGWTFGASERKKKNASYWHNEEHQHMLVKGNEWSWKLTHGLCSEVVPVGSRLRDLVCDTRENHGNSSKFKVLFIPLNVFPQNPTLPGWVRMNENDPVSKTNSFASGNQLMYFVMELDGVSGDPVFECWSGFECWAGTKTIVTHPAFWVLISFWNFKI